MSRDKIEPMSLDDAYCWLQRHEACFLPSCSTPDHQAMLSAILAWIHAEARARMNIDPLADSIEPYIREVKAEVGWPSQSE